MKLNNKGISLMEALIATAIMGANIVFYMNFQTNAVTVRSQEKVLDIVADAGRVIKKAVSNKAVCTLLMQNHGPTAASGSSTFTELTQGMMDSNDFNKAIQSTQTALENDLGNGIAIESYEVVAANNNHYLEATFNLDTENSKKITNKIIKRRYLLDAKMDTNTGNFVECLSETSNRVRSISQMTCKSQGGKTYPGSDICDVPEKVIEDPQSEDCGPGANYKLSFVDGRLQMKCTPCEVETKFVRWDCEKGKYRGLKGVNWVNFCYYKTGCKEDSIADFGEEFFIQGPTKAKGGDTGTAKNCRKKRRECPGERVALQNSEQIAIASSLNAQSELYKTANLFRTLSQHADNKSLDKIQFAFADLKIAADATDYAADRSIKAAIIAKTKKASQASDRAARAKKEAGEYFRKGLEILNKF